MNSISRNLFFVFLSVTANSNISAATIPTSSAVIEIAVKNSLFTKTKSYLNNLITGIALHIKDSLKIAKTAASYTAVTYATAGYLYVRVIKRIQLNNMYKKFLAGIHAAQNNMLKNPVWLECQDILRKSGKGFQENPTVLDAVTYMKDLRASDIDNGLLDTIFLPHILFSKALQDEKVFWLL